MASMAFLPKKLSCSKKHTGAHFPTNHIGPLINLDWKIPVRLNPLGIHRTDYRFTGWANNEWFFQRPCGNQSTIRPWFQAMMCYHSTLFGEPINMLCFFLQKTHGNKQWKISIHMSGLFKHAIQDLLHILPNSPPPWLDNHAATNRRNLR